MLKLLQTSVLKIGTLNWIGGRWLPLKGDILVLYKKLKVIPDVNGTKTVRFFCQNKCRKGNNETQIDTGVYAGEESTK